MKTHKATALSTAALAGIFALSACDNSGDNGNDEPTDEQNIEEEEDEELDDDAEDSDSDTIENDADPSMNFSASLPDQMEEVDTPLMTEGTFITYFSSPGEEAVPDVPDYEADAWFQATAYTGQFAETDIEQEFQETFGSDVIELTNESSSGDVDITSGSYELGDVDPELLMQENDENIPEDEEIHFRVFDSENDEGEASRLIVTGYGEVDGETSEDFVNSVTIESPDGDDVDIDLGEDEEEQENGEL